MAKAAYKRKHFIWDLCLLKVRVHDDREKVWRQEQLRASVLVGKLEAEKERQRNRETENVSSSVLKPQSL